MPYTGATYTESKDMYKCYELAKLLNPKMTESEYRNAVDKITSSTNYVQHVVLHDDTPVSFCATQDNLIMGAAPRLSCKINNIATMPEHRGHVTKFLLDCVVTKFRDDGYDNLNLSTYSNNDQAAKFYKKSGFEKLSDGWTLKIQNNKERTTSRL